MTSGHTPDLDIRYMALALSLGRRGQGLTWPNPSVGCVVVKNGRIVGRGVTQPGGRPHAETQALKQADDATIGATVYVSLEPCAHTGQTPPCAQAIIAAQVGRVVIALVDSDPRVSGHGVAMLQEAGIEVLIGVLEEQAQLDHSGFLMRIGIGRPRVTLKLANSFDGRIATATGESQWITGALARRHVHGLRGSHDAVLVGGGTARKDDPSLTVRDLGHSHQPTRVVVSRRLDLPLMGRLARTAQDIPLILCHGHDADPSLIDVWRDLGATLLGCEAIGGHLDPNDILRRLGDHGITSVFCEGGGALSASLLEADLVDDLIGFTAGLMIGAEGVPAIGALGLNQLSEAPRYTLKNVRAIGNDILHHWARETS